VAKAAYGATSARRIWRRRKRSRAIRRSCGSGTSGAAISSARRSRTRPIALHLAIAARTDAVVVTQNVDALHARAGSADVVELHGNLFRARCVREQRILPALNAFDATPPRCQCGALLRPDVVWFGEMLPEDAVARASAVIHAADLLLIIGTSGIVYPAAGFVAL